MDSISEIKKAVKEKKAVAGTQQTIKRLKMGGLQKIFVTVNCPADVRKDIDFYARLANCRVELLKMPNDELGVICKKPFSISVLGIK